MKDYRTRCALIATLLSAFAVILFALPSAATPISEDPSGFAQHLPLVVFEVAPSGSVDSGDAFRWPYTQQTPISFSLQDITAAWERWKTAQITANNAGGDGRLRVIGGVDAMSTVSEGQAYGMIFASLFDEQEVFDGLWLFARDYLIVNLSYFSPGYFTVFGKYTNNRARWNAVNTRNYEIVDAVQGKSNNCSGLVPNWNQYDGDAPSFVREGGYDLSCLRDS